MQQQITNKWMKKHDACPEGADWVLKQKTTDPIKLIKIAIKSKDGNLLNYANWGIVRIMSYKQYVSYAVFAAEQVIEIYEKEYPDDKRPREAIEAAKKCIDNPTEENRNASAYTAASAYATAAYTSAASAATAAAYAAANAAYAANAASAYANAANAAANAAYAAASAATAASAYATAYATAAMKIKFLEYGIKLLKEMEEK
jgi:hypothetical protein